MKTLTNRSRVGRLQRLQRLQDYLDGVSERWGRLWLQNSDYTAVAAERVSRRRALNLHATRIPGLQDRRVSQGDPKSKTEKNISSKEYHRTCISIYIYDDFVRSFHDENRKHSHCQGQWIAGCLKLVPCATSTPKLQWTIFQLLHVHLLILGIPPLEEL